MKNKIYLWIILIVINILSAFPAQVTLKYDGSGKKQHYKVNLIRKYNSDYLDIHNIAELLNFTLKHEKSIKNNYKLNIIREFEFDNQDYTFVGGMSYFAINDKIYNLPYESIFNEDQIYLPIKSFIESINNHYGSKLFSYTKRTLLIHDENIIKPAVLSRNYKDNTKVTDSASVSDFVIKDLIFDVKENGIIISLNVNRKFKKNEISISLQNKLLFLTLYKATIDSKKFNKSKLRNKFIKSISVIQLKESVQLNINLKQDPLAKSIRIKDNRIDIILPFSKKVKYSDEKLIAKLNSNNAKDETEEQPSVDRINSKNYHLVILDPGHGGKDKGKISKDSLIIEKNINLKFTQLVAEKLKEIYKSKNKKILIKFTRNRFADSYKTIFSRSIYGNKMHGDLFVSLHTFFIDTTKSIDNTYYGLTKPIIFYPGQVESHRAGKIIEEFKNNEDLSVNLEKLEQRTNYHKLDDYQYIYLKFLKIDYDYPQFITDLANSVIYRYLSATDDDKVNKFNLSVLPSEQYLLTGLNIPGFQLQFPINPLDSKKEIAQKLNLMAEIIAEGISDKLDDPDGTLFE